MAPRHWLNMKLLRHYLIWYNLVDFVIDVPCCFIKNFDNNISYEFIIKQHFYNKILLKFGQNVELTISTPLELSTRMGDLLDLPCRNFLFWILSTFCMFYDLIEVYSMSFVFMLAKSRDTVFIIGGLKKITLSRNVNISYNIKLLH